MYSEYYLSNSVIAKKLESSNKLIWLYKEGMKKIVKFPKA